VWRPPRARSLLPKVLKVCASVGREHEPEQALAVDVLTGMKADGSPASLAGCVIAARQNLKTYVLENIILTRMVDPTDSARLFIWTSQQLDTCQETFLHFVALFDNDDHPHLKRRLRKVTSGNGSEQITLTDGRRLKFKARAPKSGQGLTGDVVVFDEAFAVEPAHMGALLPTLSTRKRASVLYGSSAGHASSAILRGVRDRGRAGGRGAPAYIEWCAPGSMDDPGCAQEKEKEKCSHRPGIPGCVLDREDLVQLANPLAGREPHGIGWAYLRDEREELSSTPLVYARERLGWWDADPDEGAKHPLRPSDWEALAVAVSPDPVGVPAFFITIGPDGSAVIASASDGAFIDADLVPGLRPHVELADQRPGSDWLAGRLKELEKAWPGAAFAAGKAGPVGGLVEAGLPVEVELLPAGELAQACRHHEKLHTARGYTRSVDPDVDQSLKGAVSKPAGDGLWTWNWRASSGLAPIAGYSGALWLLEKYRQGGRTQQFFGARR
jgi:hypothetical protein